jgi:hypothetical protein
MVSYPYIHIGGNTFSPEIEERYNNWYNHVYEPELLNKLPGRRANRRYKLLEGNTGYPQYFGIHYYENERSLNNVIESRERRTYDADRDTTFAGKFEIIWRGHYELVKNIVSKEPLTGTSEAGADRPVLHIEAYDIPQEEQEKFERWLSRFGYDVYLPLLMKSCNLLEYDHYRVIYADMKTTVPVKEPDNPPYLSLFHFRNTEEYQQFNSSLEMAAFRERIQIGFQAETKWSAGYQLISSWRK